MSARNSTWRTATGDLSSISTATWITPPSHANTDGELTRMVPPAERHHRWFCSQIHSLYIFVAMQLTMIAGSSLIFFCTARVPSVCRLDTFAYPHLTLAFAYANFFSAVLAFIALELSDRIHYRGTRIWKTIAFPPAVLLLPSFVLQIVDLFVLGLHTYMEVRERYAAYEFASKSYGQILGDVLLLTFVPLLMSWTVLTYALFASLDAFFCVARRSHNWRVQQLPPATLIAHSSIKETSVRPQQMFTPSGQASELRAIQSVKTKIDSVRMSGLDGEESFGNNNPIVWNSRRRLDTIPEESMKTNASNLH